MGKGDFLNAKKIKGYLSNTLNLYIFYMKMCFIQKYFCVYNFSIFVKML